MKVKTTRRLLCILLAVTLLSSGLTAFAAMPDTAVPYYTGTARISASLDISSSGLAGCSGSISLRSGYVANLTMKLQQYTSSGGWTTIETWFTATNSSLSGSRYVASGYYYRVVTSASVYTSSGGYVESPSVNSSTKYY